MVFTSGHIDIILINSLRIFAKGINFIVKIIAHVFSDIFLGKNSDSGVACAQILSEKNITREIKFLLAKFVKHWKS